MGVRMNYRSCANCRKPIHAVPPEQHLWIVTSAGRLPWVCKECWQAHNGDKTSKATYEANKAKNWRAA